MDLQKIKSTCLKKRVIIPLAIALVVGCIGVGRINANKVKYQTQQLTKCTITDVVEASGTINPVNTVSVGSTVSGLMKAIYVDYNLQIGRASCRERVFRAV